MPAANVRILVCEPEPLSLKAEDILRLIGQVEYADSTLLDVQARARTAEVLWVRLKHYIDASILSPATRVIVTPTTGLNHIDLPTAERLGIDVLSLRGEAEFLRTVTATAEHTLSLILNSLRHTHAAFDHVLDGGWDRTRFVGAELNGKSVGIIGLGRLGKIVAGFLHALGARILASDTQQVVAPPYVEVVSLVELLNRSDIVTLHASYAPASRRFLNAECFAQMRKDAVFINTARGELVDEIALLAALQSKKLAAAALDVLDSEQIAEPRQHPLVQYARTHTNLLITPHIGGLTSDSVRKTEEFMANKLVNAIRTK